MVVAACDVSYFACNTLPEQPPTLNTNKTTPPTTTTNQLSNFRTAWEALPADTEREDDYGLGPRDGLQETAEAVVAILGMCPCEGSEAVPPNARSHTLLLSGAFPGGRRALVRLLLGMDASGSVAMKVVSRAEDAALSEAVHAIIQEA